MARGTTQRSNKAGAMTHRKGNTGEARSGVVQAEAGQAQNHRVQNATCEGLLGDGCDPVVTTTLLGPLILIPAPGRNCKRN